MHERLHVPTIRPFVGGAAIGRAQAPKGDEIVRTIVSSQRERAVARGC